MNTFFKNKYILLIVMYSLSIVTTLAQDVPPPNPPPPGLTPIDGGIVLLGIIAIAYGISKKK